MKPALISVAAFLALTLFASAQETTASTSPAPADSSTRTTGYGLLGQDYSGVTFSYLHHIDGPPNVWHRYGFDANRPTITTAGGVNLDAMFNYDYLTGSDSGVHFQQHQALVGATAFLPLGGFKPFVAGNAGWAWARNNLGNDSDSFDYRVTGGAEFQVAERLALAPYVSYQDMPHFNTPSWSYWTYGAKASFRVAREWSTTLGVEIDQHHDLEYRLGVNRHF